MTSGTTSGTGVPSGASGVGPDERWLVALDLDGTLLHHDETFTELVGSTIADAAAAGHEVMVATGRSVATTLPTVRRLGITPDFLVCSNGAVTLQRDETHEDGYSPYFVEAFDPTEVLTAISGRLSNANYAIEDEDGLYRYTGSFSDSVLGIGAEQVPFDALLGRQVTRVVVISPDHETEEFLQVVELLGLHKVSYSVGWTSWLDIAPDGVNKSTALERVRAALDIPRTRVFAMGDGRNDIEMLTWAGEHGRGVAMANAPEDVIAAASETTPPIFDEGAALALATLPGLGHRRA